MSRLQRMAALMVVMSLLGVLLAACGGGGGGAQTSPAASPGGAAESPAAESPAAESPAAESPAAESPAAGGDAGALPAECQSVELQYWNPFTGPDGPFMGELVEAFNQANPNIRVTMTTQAEYYTQLSTAAASDTLPDVAIVHADQVATQAFRNVIRPMDDIVGQIGVSGDDFPEAVWNAGEVAGSRYAIPLDIHPMTMFYNADLLGEAGISAPPTNREEFEQAAQAVTGDGNFGFMITAGFPVQQIFSMLLHQYGGSWFNEDGTEAAWNSEAGVQALQWMKDAQANYSEPNLEVDAELNAFKGGNVGMVWNGIWQTTNLTGEGVAFNGQATAVPQIGDQPAVWAGSHQLTLPSRANVDTCKDAAAGVFIRYLLDNSVTWARAGQIPANNEVRNGSEFAGVEPQASIAPSVENAIFPPSVPGITDAFAPLDEAVGSIMAGTETDIQAALDNAAQRANQILEENRQSYGETPGQ
jgi:multiple sugar transport system substrate-binding protein